MSKPGRNPEGGKFDKLPFEEALQKLETIVEAMESGELPLETMLARYEEDAGARTVGLPVIVAEPQ